MARIILKRGRGDPPKSALSLGEVCFDEESRSLLVGDPDIEKGWHKIVNVITNTEGRLYAEVEARLDLIPLYIKI